MIEHFLLRTPSSSLLILILAHGRQANLIPDLVLDHTR